MSSQETASDNPVDSLPKLDDGIKYVAVIQSVDLSKAVSEAVSKQLETANQSIQHTKQSITELQNFKQLLQYGAWAIGIAMLVAFGITFSQIPTIAKDAAVKALNEETTKKTLDEAVEEANKALATIDETKKNSRQIEAELNKLLTGFRSIVGASKIETGLKVKDGEFVTLDEHAVPGMYLVTFGLPSNASFNSTDLVLVSPKDPKNHGNGIQTVQGVRSGTFVKPHIQNVDYVMSLEGMNYILKAKPVCYPGATVLDEPFNVSFVRITTIN